MIFKQFNGVRFGNWMEEMRWWRRLLGLRTVWWRQKTLNWALNMHILSSASWLLTMAELYWYHCLVVAGPRRLQVHGVTAALLSWALAGMSTQSMFPWSCSTTVRWMAMTSCSQEWIPLALTLFNWISLLSLHKVPPGGLEQLSQSNSLQSKLVSNI